MPPRLVDYAGYRDRRDREQPSCRLPHPLVTVVSPVLNGAATIERMIRSVHAQSIGGIEHVLVDGGSQDGTVDIVRHLLRPHDYSISEADLGISDAFNKGIAMARGQYIQILAADDFLSPDQIERAVAALTETETDFVFGDVLFYERGRPTFVYVGDRHYARVIHRRMPAIIHPSVLAARHCFERFGLFDPAYRNAMDYDWLLRLHRAGARGVYRSGIVAHMTHDGTSNRQFRRTIGEVKAISVAHGRNRLVAGGEARARLVKTLASHVVKRHAYPLYRLVRRAINWSYVPTDAGTGG